MIGILNASQSPLEENNTGPPHISDPTNKPVPRFSTPRSKIRNRETPKRWPKRGAKKKKEKKRTRTRIEWERVLADQRRAISSRGITIRIEAVVIVQ